MQNKLSCLGNPFNPNGTVLLDVAWVKGGCWFILHLLDHQETPQIKQKNPKIIYELGKFTEFESSSPISSWRNRYRSEYRGAESAPRTIRVDKTHED